LSERWRADCHQRRGRDGEQQHQPRPFGHATADSTEKHNLAHSPPPCERLLTGRRARRGDNIAYIFGRALLHCSDGWVKVRVGTFTSASARPPPPGSGAHPIKMASAHGVHAKSFNDLRSRRTLAPGARPFVEGFAYISGPTGLRQQRRAARDMRKVVRILPRRP
jgi:hypothetical protein